MNKRRKYFRKYCFLVGSIGDGLVLLPTIEYTNKINRVGRGIAIVWLKWVVVIRVKDKAFDVTKVINRDFDEIAATLMTVSDCETCIFHADCVNNCLENWENWLRGKMTVLKYPGGSKC